MSANLDKSQRPTAKWCIVGKSDGYILWSYEKDFITAGKHLFNTKEEAYAYMAKNGVSNTKEAVQITKAACRAFRRAKTMRSHYVYLDGHIDGAE